MVFATFSFYITIWFSKPAHRKAEKRCRQFHKKTYMKILIFLLLFFLLGCKSYIVEYDKNGEPKLGKNMNYIFTEKPSVENLKKIDTTAYYIQIFEGRYYNENEIKNPMVLEFHNDGFYKDSSLKYYKNFSYRTKETIWYGGKYKISGNTIELESFAPSNGSKTKIYIRTFLKGRIVNDKIIFDDKKNNSLISVYQKNINLNKRNCLQHR